MGGRHILLTCGWIEHEYIREARWEPARDVRGQDAVCVVACGAGELRVRSQEEVLAEGKGQCRGRCHHWQKAEKNHCGWHFGGWIGKW